MNRDFLPDSVTVLTIFNAIDGKTQIQSGDAMEAFRRRWMRLTATVWDVQDFMGRYVVAANYEEYISPGLRLTFAERDSQLETLTQGEIIEIEGRVAQSGRMSVAFEDCRLLSRSPAAPKVSPLLQPAEKPRGRPPKAYWEAALLHFFELIYNGDFKPKDQAQIEAAMAQWISENHDDNPSESTIRQRAAKVWNIYTK